MTAQHRNFHVAAILVAATFCAFPASAFAAEVDPEERYRQAAEHFTAGRWDEAAAAFRTLVDDAKPETAPSVALVEQSRFYLGESLVHLQRPAEAIDAFVGFLAASTDETLVPIARYRLGEACYSSSRFDEARVAFTALIDDAEMSGRWPATTPRALYYLGDLAQRKGHSDDAAAWFGRLTAMYPDDELYAAAALSRVEALVAQREHAAAWAALRGLYEVAQPTSQASLLAAQILDALKNHAEAAEAYDRYFAAAAQDDERRESLLYDSAWNLLALNRSKDAAARFDELVKSYPTSKLAADAGYRAAEYEFSVGHHAEATKQLAVALKTADEKFAPYIHMLELRIALAAGDRAQAEAAVAAIGPSLPEFDADHWHAEIAYLHKDWDEAADRFAAVVKKRDKDHERFAAAVARQIESLAQAGRWAETITAVESSRTSLPKDAARFELEYLCGRAHAARAEFREAREAYKLALADPRSKGTETAVLAQFMTAETHFHQRDYAAALADYEPVVAQDAFAEWRAAALLQSGKCQEQLGRSAEAKQLYDRLIAEFADSAYAVDAVRRRDAVLRQAEATGGNVQRK